MTPNCKKSIRFIPLSPSHSTCEGERVGVRGSHKRLRYASEATPELVAAPHRPPSSWRETRLREAVSSPLAAKVAPKGEGSQGLT